MKALKLLPAQGFKYVKSVNGGINAWSDEIDQTVASLAMIMHGRLQTRPMPVTTPAAGISPQPGYIRWPAQRLSSSNELAEVTYAVVERFQTNAPARRAPISLAVSPGELAALNSGQPVRINMVERYLVPGGDEDMRINDIDLTSFTMAVNGPVLFPVKHSRVGGGWNPSIGLVQCAWQDLRTRSDFTTSPDDLARPGNRHCHWFGHFCKNSARLWQQLFPSQGCRPVASQILSRNRYRLKTVAAFDLGKGSIGRGVALRSTDLPAR